MSKINAIRKKALELVRKQDWPAAIKEYRRLADIDQSNPNVNNELGDLYLKTNAKNEAYESFVRAIDSYTRVSLHNNAVAVCKKVLRLIPSRYEVLAKLGLIRLKQGLGKEAESYYTSYLDKLAIETAVDPKEIVKNTSEIVDGMTDSVPLHERASECLLQHNLKDEAGRVLVKLYRLHRRRGQEASLDSVREKMDSLGLLEMLANADDVAPAKAGTVITEENIWDESHSEGERIPVVEGEGESGSVYEYGNVEMPGVADGTAATADGTPPPPSNVATAEAQTGVIAGPAPEQPVADAAAPGLSEINVTPPEPAAPAAPEPPPVTEPPPAHEAFVPPANPAAPPSAAPTGGPNDGGPAPGPSSDVVHVSAIIDESDHDGGELSDEDYRSHYDLGMAYLEMDLLAEAVREYQFAAKSPQFRVKSLEMVGLCFLKQNQPKLAIKQLEKGLQLIGHDDREALGIRYNLGLAYEQIGDLDNARSQFEDVYVVDVTFRDVAEKVQKLNG